MSKALELAKFGRETPPTGTVVGDSDTQTLSSKTFSDGPVFSSGAVNAVPYLNASKVFSTSSTFVFDGTNLGVGVASPAQRLDVNGTVKIGSGSGETLTLGSLDLGKDIGLADGYGIVTGNARVLTFRTGGNVGLGTASPAYKLEIASGTSGQQSLAGFRTADATIANNAGLMVFATPSATATSRSVAAVWDADGANASGGDYFSINKNGNSGSVDLFQYSNAEMKFAANYIARATVDMTLSAAGNLGLGTTPSTGAKFQVTGYTDFWNTTNTLLRVQHDGSRGKLQSYTGGAAGNIALNPDGGSVGIATDNPQEKLHVQGKMRVFDGGYPYIDLGINTSNYFRIIHDNPTDRLLLGKNGTAAFAIDGSGFAHFYAQGVAGAGTINLTSADPFIRFTATGGTADKQKWDIRAISYSGSEALEFRTINDANNVFSTKLWIGNDGRVSIGTTTSDEKLTVAGNIRLYGNQAVVFQQLSGVAVGAISFRNSSGVQKAAIGSYYNIADEGAIEFVGSTLTNMVLRSSGNLHIGATNDPGYRLGLTSDTTGDGILIDVLSNPTIVLRDRGNSDTKIGTGGTAGLDNFYVSTYSTNHALMIKGSDGFVGIGTNDPGERLTVNGSIRSTTNAVNFNGQTGAQFDYYNGEMRFATHNGTTTSIMYFNAGTGKLNVPGTVINNQGGGVGGTSRYYAAATITPTSTSNGVAIYDIHLPDYFSVSAGMDLELYIHANPNGGGSGDYRQTKHITAHCLTNWHGSGYTPFLEYDSVNDYMGLGVDCVIFFQPSGQEFTTQVTSTAANNTSYFWSSTGVYLRVKVTGFNASYPGHHDLALIVGHRS